MGAHTPLERAIDHYAGTNVNVGDLDALLRQQNRSLEQAALIACELRDPSAMGSVALVAAERGISLTPGSDGYSWATRNMLDAIHGHMGLVSGDSEQVHADNGHICALEASLADPDISIAS